ncbi:hypothetical protein O3G_MSEX005425 [Manduca sexta]|uniref:Uncharacterized protein n=1 Tax=Manduca sexta TaxID=7130 RepID=A0A922CJN3_MANSE|nr:hypothetical protein O3G_MSEX005425 [Manduca sexta]
MVRQRGLHSRLLLRRSHGLQLPLVLVFCHHRDPERVAGCVLCSHLPCRCETGK